MHCQGRQGKLQLESVGTLIPFLVFFLGCILPWQAHAEGISGFVEIDGAYSKVSEKPIGSAARNTKVYSLLQRYNLVLDRDIYPNLRLNAGGLFENDISDATVDGVKNHANSTQISPNATLTFGNPFVSSALGYARNEQTTQSAGVSSPKDVVETYTARLGLRPEGLPTLSFLFSRANAFSSDRSIKDNTSDSYTISSQYKPARSMDLNYQGVLTDTTDRVSESETSTLFQSVTGRYTNRFFDRISFYTSGTFSDNETSFSRIGTGGVITTPLSRLAGFFAVSNTPDFIQRNPNDQNLTPPIITWTSVPALIDNDKRTATNPIINLGVQPVIGGDTRLRNIGLDLAVTTTINTLYVYVTQNLPISISRQFTWSVYTSSDNENWTIQQNAIQSPPTFEQVFDPLTQALVQRFTILTSDITTRYIKVVTAPLPQQPPPLPVGVDLNNILVTEMEAAVRTSTGQAPTEKTSFQSGSVMSSVRATILEKPSLPSVFYDLNFNYNFNRGSTTGMNYNYFVSTGLSAYHKFNQYVSGGARVAWEDTEGSQQQSSTAYVYNVSLEAHPLAALSHNITYSGRQATVGGKLTTTDSLALSNSAALYQGISVNLSGGLSTSSVQDGARNETKYASFGINLVPHRTVTMNISYSGSWSDQSGGGQPASSTTNSSGTVQVTYNPLPAVSLFGSLGFSAASGTQTLVTQNFGGSWSPFRDGALQFGFAYSESLVTPTNERIRTASPSAQWIIRPGWWLTVSYSYQTTTSPIDETELNAVSTTLRLSF